MNMKTNRRAVVAALFMATMMASTAQAEEKQFNSPDGKISVTVNDEGGKPTYAVKFDGASMLERSPLGVKANYADLTQQLTLKSCDLKTVTDQYDLKTWKQSHVSYQATEAVCQFNQGEWHALDIIFRVSNRDVAFSYKLYPKRARGGETLVAVVENEASGFVLPDGTTTFLCPQSRPMGGFARTSPSYETGYSYDDEMGKNGWGEGYSFPCLFKVPYAATPSQQSTTGWVLISETGTDGDYVACRLLNDGGAKYKIGFPQPGELNGHGSTSAAVSLPCQTPWRTITLGASLAPIVESTVANDLVQPKYKASKDYTYGKGSWSWIIGMDGSCNFDEQKRYIDFSAAMGWRSVLVDALWDKQIGYEKMEELARYGRSKGVGLFLWYNSNGAWNDAPQSPKDKMDKSAARRKEMAWMQKNGILGIKVDFFGGDKQPMMQLYEDILTDANDFGLQVIFHGCTLPRGWERMYPNYVASEAVLASENLHFGQGACDAEAQNACTHVFIRNVVASMDFGGSTLNKHYNADNQHGTTRRTSDVFALATAVLFQSSVQHFAMAPNNLTDAPDWAVQFMKDVPTQWDEVKFIDGYPGKYAIIARRSGQKWYVAAICAQADPVKMKLDLSPFFAKGTAVTAYTDDAQLKGKSQTLTLKNLSFKAEIPQNGALLIVGDAK
ncbi:MAG: glycoside hydrolase family 97 protein [Prevotella sp.]|nr:glycoside hydrolase family 97 protein [Prevotella sp.]